MHCAGSACKSTWMLMGNDGNHQAPRKKILYSDHWGSKHHQQNTYGASSWPPPAPGGAPRSRSHCPSPRNHPPPQPSLLRDSRLHLQARPWQPRSSTRFRRGARFHLSRWTPRARAVKQRASRWPKGASIASGGIRRCSSTSVF